jgi:hypothetical protein
LLISSRSVNKHVRHRQFLFLIGRFLKIFSETYLSLVKKLVCTNWTLYSIISNYAFTYFILPIFHTLSTKYFQLPHLIFNIIYNDPYVFVHADDIKTLEKFFSFTKQFFLFKQDKLVSVLTCSMHMHCVGL